MTGGTGATGRAPERARGCAPAPGNAPAPGHTFAPGNAPARGGGPARGATILVLVDLQNDFCVGPVAAGRFGGDPAALATVVDNAARAVDLARATGTEVVFVRFLGDRAHQGPSWRRRDRALGKAPKCVEGTWGAEFTGVRPAGDERVFTKPACFDAFLSEGFEDHLRARGARRLVLAGLFADVCVDSTARGAFQRGLEITVLSDCTTALHLSLADSLRFMARVYGARVVAHREPWTPGHAGHAALAEEEGVRGG